MQFLFLYSHHPSGGMGDLPKRLEEAWRVRHKQASQLAFEKLKNGEIAQPKASFFNSATAEEEAPVNGVPAFANFNPFK